jgi:hypothetical protein
MTDLPGEHVRDLAVTWHRGTGAAKPPPARLVGAGADRSAAVRAQVTLEVAALHRTNPLAALEARASDESVS